MGRFTELKEKIAAGMIPDFAEMTPEQLAEQRRSFAFGNCNIENPLVTREMIAEADRRLFGQES